MNNLLTGVNTYGSQAGAADSPAPGWAARSEAPNGGLGAAKAAALTLPRTSAVRAAIVGRRVSGQTQARRAELGVQRMGMSQKPMASFPPPQPVTVDQWVVNAM